MGIIGGEDFLNRVGRKGERKERSRGVEEGKKRKEQKRGRTKGNDLGRKYQNSSCRQNY